MGWPSHFDASTVVPPVSFAISIRVDPMKAPLIKHLSPWQPCPLHMLPHHSHRLVVGSSPPKSSPELQGKEPLQALVEVCDLYTSVSSLTKLQCHAPNDQPV